MLRTLLALTLVLQAVSLGRGADAHPAFSFRLCASAQILQAAADKIARTAPSLQAFQRSSITVRDNGSLMSFALNGTSVDAVKSAGQLHACQYSGNPTTLLANGTLVPGDVVAALAAVDQYRATHTWPEGGPAELTSSAAYVILEATNDGYFTVVLADPPSGRNARGKLSVDGCTGVEDYRVTPSSYRVLPFHGCTMYNPKSGLPGYYRLPK